MITPAQIQALAEEKIDGTDIFIVEISVKPGNKIEVLVDRDSGLTVENCKMISRHIENSLDREKEDFGIDVSSPGVGRPLKVLRQYLKDIGRTVKVETNDGQKIEGQMSAATETEISVITQSKEEVPGKKGKKLVERTVLVPYSNIKETKIVISFK